MHVCRRMLARLPQACRSGWGDPAGESHQYKRMVDVVPDALGEEMTTQGKGYLRPMEATWWLHNKQLMLFMLRELTSVFVAGYAVYLLFLIGYRNSPAKFAELARSPGAIFFQIIALPFLIFHSVTWFNLTPKAI